MLFLLLVRIPDLLSESVFLIMPMAPLLRSCAVADQIFGGNIKSYNLHCKRNENKGEEEGCL